MLNKTFIIGNVGQDPESKQTLKGGVMVKFSVGVSEKIKGEQNTQWFNCKSFNSQAEYIQRNVQKRTKVYIEGVMKSNKYEDKTYWDLLVNKIEILDGRKQNDNYPRN